MSYSDLVLVILTALGVMLAVLTIIIGVVAAWGFTEMKGFLRGTAERRVDETLITKMAQWEETIKQSIQNQLVTYGSANQVEIEAEAAIKDREGVAPVAAPYPAEEPPHADDGDDA